MNNNIGIGITAYKRPETDKKAIDEIIRLAPEGAKIVIIQDVEGIATAKNNCLALLDECEHIFLFDSDTYPIKQYWWLPYTESGINHLCFTFNKLIDGRQNGNRNCRGVSKGIAIYENPCGCMLYINRKCLEVVGGFDEDYKGYAYEHCDLSRRIHNAGLTEFPFMDVSNSLELFHSMDYHMEVQSSVKPEDRMRHIRLNRVRYNEEMNSKAWKPYR